MNFDFNKLEAINVLSDNTLEATIESNIADTEAYLMNVCYEYGIDYHRTGACIDEYSYPLAVTEGILSGALSIIRRIVKGAVKFLISLWKKLVSFVKACFRAVLNMFGLGKKSATFSKPVKFNLISLEGAYVSSQTADSFEDMKKIAELNIKAISQEIKDRSREQIEYTEQLNKLQPVKEGREIRGGDHNLFHAEMDRRLTAAAANDPNLKKMIEDQERNDPYGEQMGTLQRDAIDMMRNSGTKYFAIAKEKALLESENIVEEYNKWVECEFQKIIVDGAPLLACGGSPEKMRTTSGESVTNASVMALVTASYYGMKQYGFSDEEIMSYLKGAMLTIPEDPEAVRTMIKLRLNYNRHTCDLLERMLKINFKVLGYSKEDAMSLIKALRNQDAKAVENIRSKLASNINNYITRPGVIDLTPIGGGVLYYTTEDLGGIKSYVNTDDGGHLMNYLLRYDCVLLSHGGTETKKDDAYYDDMDKTRRERGKFLKFCVKMAQKYRVRLENSNGDPFDPESDTYGEIVSVISEDVLPKMTDDEHDEFDRLDRAWGDAQSKFSKTKREKHWFCQPLRVADNPPSTDVNTCVKYAIDAGYKRILVLSCNPGHHRLDSKMIKRAKGVIVHYATSKLFA